MIKPMREREFYRLTREMIESVALPLGFVEYDSHYFKRPRGDIEDVFAPDPRLEFHYFDVLYGIYVPSRRERYISLTGINQPTPTISEHLEPGSWGAANVAQLEKYVPGMLEKFKETALPWFEQYQTLADVVAEFNRRKIDDTDHLAPNPYIWADYGWMLEEIGQRDEAVPWLRKAYDEVTRPLFVKNDRFVPESTKGAHHFRRDPEDERLAELLRESLQLSVT